MRFYNVIIVIYTYVNLCHIEDFQPIARHNPKSHNLLGGTPLTKYGILGWVSKWADSRPYDIV